MRLSVCLSVCTLTVAFLDRFSPKVAQRLQPPKCKNEFVGAQHRTTLSHLLPPKPQFWRRGLRFQVKLEKSKNMHIIKTTAQNPTKICTATKTIKWVRGRSKHMHNISKMADGAILNKNSSGDEIANVNLLRQHRTCRPRDQRLRPFNEFVIST